jgi:predicted alpha/beta superfamily hydrolase
MLPQTLDWLISTNQIPPIVAIGIASPNDAARWYEYTPWPGTLIGDPIGGGGPLFLQEVKDVLMPAMRARFRTYDAYVIGVSLGGLMATYSGYADASPFVGFGALSPTYGWADARIITFADSVGRHGLKRVYFDTGTARDNSVGFLRAMLEVALNQGFVNGVDLGYQEARGHEHRTDCWRERLPAALRTLFGNVDSLDTGEQGRRLLEHGHSGIARSHFKTTRSD